MAFFKEALNERGSAGRGAGGNSAWIKSRSFLSRATCSGVNFPVRKTRFQTFLAMSLPPFPFALRNFVGGDHAHRIFGNLFINDDDKAAIGRISPYRGEPGGFAGPYIGRVIQHMLHVFDSQIMLGNMFDITVRIILVIPDKTPEIHEDPRDLMIADWRLVVN